MTDRELLELAARSIGVEGVFDENTGDIWRGTGSISWNSLKYDGDALRLAVKLSIPFHVFYEDGSVITYGKKSKHHPEGLDIQELFTSDPCAATRRAITRAAAEIEMSKCKDN